MSEPLSYNWSARSRPTDFMKLSCVNVELSNIVVGEFQCQQIESFCGRISGKFLLRFRFWSVIKYDSLHFKDKVVKVNFSANIFSNYVSLETLHKAYPDDSDNRLPPEFKLTSLSI